MSIQTEFDSWTKKENEMTHLSTVRHLPVWIKVLALAPLLPNIGLFVKFNVPPGTEPYVQGKSFIKLEISFSN